MTKEALTLALEALETSARNWPSDSVIEAITAIKEALAQPAVAEQHKQEPDCVGTGVCVQTGLVCLGQPPQRTWVDLTDDEFEDIEMSFTPTNKIGAMMAVEAKLKEKNT